MDGWRDRIVGLDEEVPLLDERMVPYINLDNAASTPPLREVVDAVQDLLRHYSSVHRGTGFKSRLSTAVYDEAHDTIAQFVGADTRTNTVIFVKNTTEAIDKLAFRVPLTRDSVVVSTMEHHSNDLPWRRRASVVRAGVTPEGRLDEDDVDRFNVHGVHHALVAAILGYEAGIEAERLLLRATVCRVPARSDGIGADRVAPGTCRWQPPGTTGHGAHQSRRLQHEEGDR